MVENDGPVFRPVIFEFGQVHIAGGHTKKTMVAKTKTVPGPDAKQNNNVKIAGNEAWSLAAASGSGDKNRSAFGRTSLLDIMRVHIARLSDGIDALEGAPVVAAADHDPMNEIGSVAAAPKARWCNFIGGRYTRTRTLL